MMAHAIKENKAKKEIVSGRMLRVRQGMGSVFYKE